MARGKKKAPGPSSRPVQVGEQLRQFISGLLLEGGIKDPRLDAASMVTVTEVRMTPDLRLARVLVSVFPEDEAVVAQVFEGLRSAAGELKREIGRKLDLRFTPELEIVRDDSISTGAHIEKLLKEIHEDQEPDATEPGDAD